MSIETIVRLGIVEMGNVGTAQVRNITAVKMLGQELVAELDVKRERCEAFLEVKAFSSVTALIQSREVDAALIAARRFGMRDLLHCIA